MRKREELADPNSCMGRARDDEMTFVLLGRDAAAPVAIEAWIAERIRLGKNKPHDKQIVEARGCAYAMQPSGASPSPDLKAAADRMADRFFRGFPTATRGDLVQIIAEEIGEVEAPKPVTFVVPPAPAKSVGEAAAELAWNDDEYWIAYGEDSKGPRCYIRTDDIGPLQLLRNIHARAIDAAVAEADDRAAKIVQESHLTRTPLAAAIRERGKVSNV